MEQKALTFLKSIEKEDIPQFVLLHGEEEYLVRTIIDKLREKFGGSFCILWGDEVELSQLIGELSERDIFSSTARRAVFVMNFNEFLKKISRSKKSMGLLVRTVEGMKGSSLITHFPHRLKPQDLKKEPFSSLTKRGAVVSADRLPARKIEEILRKKFEKEAGGIEEEALRLLISLTGGDLMVLKQESEKLITYAGGRRITLEMVSEVSAPWSRSDAFELVDSLFLGNLEGFLRSLKDLKREGAIPLQLMALITGYGLRLYALARMAEKGADEEKALADLGIKGGFQTAKFKKFLENWKGEKARRLIMSLYTLERSVKTEFLEPFTAMENFALSLLRK